MICECCENWLVNCCGPLQLCCAVLCGPLQLCCALWTTTTVLCSVDHYNCAVLCSVDHYNCAVLCSVQAPVSDEVRPVAQESLCRCTGDDAQ